LEPEVAPDHRERPTSTRLGKQADEIADDELLAECRTDHPDHPLPIELVPALPHVVPREELVIRRATCVSIADLLHPGRFTPAASPRPLHPDRFTPAASPRGLRVA